MTFTPRKKSSATQLAHDWPKVRLLELENIRLENHDQIDEPRKGLRHFGKGVPKHQFRRAVRVGYVFVDPWAIGKSCFPISAGFAFSGS